MSSVGKPPDNDAVNKALGHYAAHVNQAKDKSDTEKAKKRKVDLKETEKTTKPPSSQELRSFDSMDQLALSLTEYAITDTHAPQAKFEVGFAKEKLVNIMIIIAQVMKDVNQNDESMIMTGTKEVQVKNSQLKSDNAMLAGVEKKINAQITKLQHPPHHSWWMAVVGIVVGVVVGVALAACSGGAGAALAPEIAAGVDGAEVAGEGAAAAATAAGEGSADAVAASEVASTSAIGSGNAAVEEAGTQVQTAAENLTAATEESNAAAAASSDAAAEAGTKGTSVAAKAAARAATRAAAAATKTAEAAAALSEATANLSTVAAEQGVEVAGMDAAVTSTAAAAESSAAAATAAEGFAAVGNTAIASIKAGLGSRILSSQLTKMGLMMGGMSAGGAVGNMYEEKAQDKENNANALVSANLSKYQAEMQQITNMLQQAENSSQNTFQIFIVQTQQQMNMASSQLNHVLTGWAQTTSSHFQG
jgi:hypothetical protein